MICVRGNRNTSPAFRAYLEFIGRNKRGFDGLGTHGERREFVKGIWERLRDVGFRFLLPSSESGGGYTVMTRERSILKCRTALYDAGRSRDSLIVVQSPHEKSQEEGLGRLVQHRLEMLAYVREARIFAESEMSILQKEDAIVFVCTAGKGVIRGKEVSIARQSFFNCYDGKKIIEVDSSMSLSDARDMIVGELIVSSDSFVFNVNGRVIFR